MGNPWFQNESEFKETILEHTEIMVNLGSDVRLDIELLSRIQCHNFHIFENIYFIWLNYFIVDYTLHLIYEARITNKLHIYYLSEQFVIINDFFHTIVQICTLNLKYWKYTYMSNKINLQSLRTCSVHGLPWFTLQNVVN